MSVIKYMEQGDIEDMVQLICGAVQARLLKNGSRGFGTTYSSNEILESIKLIADHQWSTHKEEYDDETCYDSDHCDCECKHHDKDREEECVGDKQDNETFAGFIEKAKQYGFMQAYEINSLVEEKLSRHVKKYIDSNYLTQQVNNEIDQLRTQMQAQSAGVQRVYEQFAKLTDTNILQDWEAERARFEQERAKMKADIDSCRQYINQCEKKLHVVNELYKLRHCDSELIEKLAEIVETISKV